MNDIYSLLNIDNKMLESFPVQGNLVIDKDVDRGLRIQTKRLNEIQVKLGLVENGKIRQFNIEKLVKEIKKRYSEGTLNISPMELRTLSYYMHEFYDTPLLHNYILSSIKNSNHSFYLKGLLFSVMNNWLRIPFDLKQNTISTITDKLKACKQSNRIYTTLKKNIDYINANGPLRIATFYAVQDSSFVFNMPEAFCYPNEYIYMEYFSDALIAYFKKTKIDSGEQFSLLDKIFTLHQLSRTKKIIFCDMVEKADTHHNEIEKGLLSKCIARNMGDISIKATWAPFDGATQNEIDKLENAYRLVNKWMIQKVIDVFFDVCMQDSRRKNFWLKYVDHITYFRIVGSDVVFSMIKSDPRISDSVSRYFVTTSSSVRKTAALILYIKNKVIIEFSDTGALYVYDKNDKVIPRGRYCNSIDDLKQPYLNKLVESNPSYYDYYYDTGRLIHSGDWESRLSRWLRYKLKI